MSWMPQGRGEGCLLNLVASIRAPHHFANKGEVRIISVLLPIFINWDTYFCSEMPWHKNRYT